MKLASTILLVATLVLGCRSEDLSEDDLELQKFFDSLNPVENVEIKKDSKSILREYLNEKKDLKKKQKLKEAESPKLKLRNREKLPLSTAGKNVVGLMQQVEKLIKKSIKISDKTVPINIDFNAIDSEPIVNVKLDQKKKSGLPKRNNGDNNSAPSANGVYNDAPSEGDYSSAPSRDGYNGVPSGGGYNGAPSGGSYNGAPSGGIYNSAPSGSGYNGVPSGGGYNGVPSGGGYNGSPSGGSYNSAPSGSGYTKAPTSSYPGSPYGSNYYQQQQGYKKYGQSYDKDYKEKEPIIIEHKPLKFAPKEHSKKKHKEKYLDLHDYKSIWLQMIFNVYKLMENKHYMKGDAINFKTLKMLFNVLKGISILPQKKKKHVCPYSYDTAGSLCLTAEYLLESLTYDEARQYCQLIKGGDLVIIRNACEFKEVVQYLEEIDPYRTKNYWIGANDVYHEGHWTNVDGSIFPLGPPFWGKVLGVLEPSGSDPVIPGKEDYGMMIGADFFYVHDVSDNQGTALHGIPLCQYVHQRDRYQKNSEKPKGWGPYASYNEWKRHKQNNIFDKYFSYDNNPMKPENPFEEYGHFNYKPPEEDFTSDEYQISPYVKPTVEDNNPYESEGASGEYYEKPPEYEHKPVISGSYVGTPDGSNELYASSGPDQEYYVKPPDKEYSSYEVEKPYQVLPEVYPEKEPYKPSNEGYNNGYDQVYLEKEPYKPINEGYYNGYDQAHLENEYLESIHSYGDHGSECKDCIYQGPSNYGNPTSGYPVQQGSYGNPSNYLIQQASNSNPNGYPVQQGSTDNTGGYPVQQGSYGSPSGYPIQQGSYGNPSGYPVQQGSFGSDGSYPVQQGNYVNPSGYPVQQGSFGSDGSYPVQQVSYVNPSGYPVQQESYVNTGSYQVPQENYGNPTSYPTQLQRRVEVHGNTTLNAYNPQIFNASSEKIKPHNIEVLNLGEPNMKDNPSISHIQYQEGFNGMLKDYVPSQQHSTILDPGQQLEPSVNNGGVQPNSHIYYHVGTAHSNIVPENSPLNPIQIIQTEQNSQLNPVPLIPANQNSQLNPVQYIQADQSPQLNPAVQLIQSDHNSQLNPVHLVPANQNSQLNPTFQFIQSDHSSQLNPFQLVPTNQNPQLNPAFQLIQSGLSSQLNSVQLTPANQNSQLNPVQLIRANQNSPYINPITDFQYDKSSPSVGLISVNSFPGTPTQVNHIVSPQILHNNFNQNNGFYSQPNHNPITALQQTSVVNPYNSNGVHNTGNNLPSQDSMDQIFVIQGNLQHGPIHKDLQPQNADGSVLPDQFYLGNTLVPSQHETTQSHFNGHSQNNPFNLGSTAPLQQSSLQPQIYVIRNSQLSNSNLHQLHPQQTHISEVNSAAPLHSVPVQIMHVSDLRSQAFSPDLVMVNNQLPQTSLSKAPNYQPLTLSNQPSSTALVHSSIYSLQNPEDPSSHFSPNHGINVNVGKHYRSEMNFPERFSEMTKQI